MNEGKTRLGKFDKWGYTNMFSKKELARELVYTNEDNNNLRQEIERLNKNLDTSIEICNKRQKEIVRLNNIIKQQEEDIEEYNDKLNEVVKDRNKYLHITNELEKWLIERSEKVWDDNNYLDGVLDKLKELKEGK